jgi:hypothetical protein
LLPRYRCLERGPLWLEVVAPEPGDVVEREAAPVGAEGWVGGAIFRDRRQHLIERLLAQRAA